MEKRYPFRFLDAYRREDIDFFFGRKDEIETLYQMTFQANILLVYGTSGTGKTSLIQCGLANKFQTYDWLALYIRRGKNLIASLDKSLCAEGDDVFTYAESDKLIIKDLAKKIESVYRASFKPIYLIFDQFEEIYILGTRNEQEQFIQTIKEILLIEQPVKVIISIREEYLGYLYEFERIIPELLRKKLRVEPMSLDKVKTVIKGVNSQPQSNVRLHADEEDAIAEGIFAKIRGEEKTLSIQLPYLQVFLDNLYLQATKDKNRQTDAVFTLADLEKLGDIGDVLRNFLDEQVMQIGQNLNQKPETIWQILSPFVTLEGTKEPLSEKKHRQRMSGIDTALLGDTLQACVNCRILRYTENEQIYEIAHDSLAKQIQDKRSDEEIAIMEVQRLIRSQSALKSEARSFFTEKQLLLIEPYLSKFKLGDEEQEWITKSRENVEAQKKIESKRQAEELAETKKRLLITRVLLALALILIVVTYYSISVSQEKSRVQTILKRLYNSEIKRYNGEIEVIKRNQYFFVQYNSGEDVIQLGAHKMDSLSKCIDSLHKEIILLEK